VQRQGSTQRQFLSHAEPNPHERAVPIDWHGSFVVNSNANCAKATKMTDKSGLRMQLFDIIIIFRI
jgi:hypothetical protein